MDTGSRRATSVRATTRSRKAASEASARAGSSRSSCGHVDDPAQAHIVVGIDDDLEVREGVLDLAPLVEAHPSDDPVRHAGAHECVFYGARLRIRAVEHGDHVFGILRQRAPGGPHDEVGLLELVAPAERQDLRAPLPIGPEALVLAVAILPDDGRCRVENHLRRAVVLLQPHDARVREVALEVEDVLQVGPAPLVDRLVGVADDAEVAVVLG